MKKLFFAFTLLIIEQLKDLSVLSAIIIPVFERNDFKGNLFN